MKRRILLILLCVVFLAIAGISGIRLYRQWQEYRTGEESYEALTQYVHVDETLPAAIADTMPEPTTAAIDTPEPEVDTTVWPEVDFEALQAVNPDVVAWIFIEGTSINYPVVQGTDNSYYLDHLFDGTYNNAGSIFMDYRNERDLSDRNTVFYGHRMQSKTMFATIVEYKNQSFYDAHPICLIMTPNGNYKLEFFAGYVTDLNSQAWKLEFESDEEYAQWLEEAISKSTFSSPVQPAAQDRVVTFSTCTYEYNDARYVLVGVLN